MVCTSPCMARPHWSKTIQSPCRHIKNATEGPGTLWERFRVSCCKCTRDLQIGIQIFFWGVLVCKFPKVQAPSSTTVRLRACYLSHCSKIKERASEWSRCLALRPETCCLGTPRRSAGEDTPHCREMISRKTSQNWEGKQIVVWTRHSLRRGADVPRTEQNRT